MIFTKKELENYADVLIWGITTARTKKFKKGDIIRIAGHIQALPLIEILNRKCLERGWNPAVRILENSTMEHDFYEIANNKQLSFVAPWEEKFFESINGSIFVDAPDSITHLSDIDPSKIAKSAVPRKFLRDIMSEREENGLFGWTISLWPTQTRADKAGLTLKQFKNQIVKSCFLHLDDPVGQWQKLFRDAIKIKKWLNRMKVDYYHVQTKNMNLKITPGEKRRWIGVSGHNIPSFEMFISPDWRGTEGIYYADQPSYRSGNYVEKVCLEFKKGKVVNAKAEKGNNFLNKQLNMDEGASKVGEFSLTDKRFSNINKFMANTLYDENFGGKNGNCHIACGQSYSDTYSGDLTSLTGGMKEELGFNESSLHWDLVNTESKTVQAYYKGKSKIIYQNGMFTCNI